ncbi:MAG TPA: SDR family oxidoreductase [Candidatus Binatia bacterium]|nr:SDR family oxidoreductase [Candidatus Binatia bacterium]
MAGDLSLEARVAIITGGAGGMGSVMTLALIGDGARVVAIDTLQDRLDALATKAATIGGEGSFLGLRADITLVEECDRVVDAVLTRFSAVHILVNAAGIGMQTIRANYMKEPVRFWEIEPERWQKLMDVNWKGAFLMARAVTPHLLRQGWGRIVNVTTSLDTMYRGNYTPYGMSKAALEAATVSWSEDLKGSGVTVNVLVPGGPTNTSFIPQGAPFDRAALVQPEVMAAPIHWLASPASDRITGCRIVARDWDVKLAPDEAAKAACAPAAWQDVKTKAFWPGKS